jgi:hypothetical protein
MMSISDGRGAASVVRVDIHATDSASSSFIGTWPSIAEDVWLSRGRPRYRTRVALYLRELGFSVLAVVRRREDAVWLANCGLTPVERDVTDSAARIPDLVPGSTVGGPCRGSHLLSRRNARTHSGDP